MAKSVCIVGAGPAGLVAAKTFLHNAPQQGGAGGFTVSVFDGQSHIGGLWPTSKTDTSRQIHPLMVANQSRHTVQFSDLAWDDGAPQLPRAWQVGRYLERYASRYLSSHPAFRLHLGTRVVDAQPDGDAHGQGDAGGWTVRVRSEGGQERTQHFTHLVVASGYFGEPIVPRGIHTTPASAPVPVLHSSQYRDLESLLGGRASARGTILVVGGQMSGVEISATIATHLSSATHAPDPFSVPDIEHCSVHHLVQGPMWVLPLYTTPEPKAAAAPFLPLDFPAYNRSNRPVSPLVNTSGHIDEAAAQTLHGIFEASLGSDQSPFSPLLRIAGNVRSEPPYLAASDWYCDLVRSGLIRLTNGKFASLDSSDGNTVSNSDNNSNNGNGNGNDGGTRNTTTTAARAILADGSAIDDVVAVILATGFDPSPCLSYLPPSVLAKLHHSPAHSKQPLALAFHATHHPQVPNLAFVGFYRSPYWGVMQMQARFLAEYWSSSSSSSASRSSSPSASALQQKLQQDTSIQRTLDLRDDPRVAQFPMGDYAFLMQEFAEALSIPIAPLASPSPPATLGNTNNTNNTDTLTTTSSSSSIPRLSHNGLPLDMLTPARYPSPSDDAFAQAQALHSRRDTARVITEGLTTPRFVPRAVFRSLLGTWKLERDLESRLPSHPSGHFSGTARFLLRAETSDGLQCAQRPADDADAKPKHQDADDDDDDAAGMEYLYVEDGEFTTDQGFGFRATRRYVWRYDEKTETLSVWFAKPDDPKRADYLFHEIEFLPSGSGSGNGWAAKAGHLCIDDFYNVAYEFVFDAVNLRDWRIQYTVSGPKKDYTIRGHYNR